MTYSLTGMAGLGTCTEHQDKDSGLFQMPMPGSDSSSQILIDIFGTTRTIKLTGRFSLGDTGYASVAAFIVALDTLNNGAQTSRTYHSDKSGLDYQVLVTSASWDAEEADVNSVPYEINMVEGAV
jgi:hypothetical protein